MIFLRRFFLIFIFFYFNSKNFNLGIFNKPINNNKFILGGSFTTGLIILFFVRRWYLKFKLDLRNISEESFEESFKNGFVSEYYLLSKKKRELKENIRELKEDFQKFSKDVEETLNRNQEKKNKLIEIKREENIKRLKESLKKNSEKIGEILNKDREKNIKNKKEEIKELDEEAFKEKEEIKKLNGKKSDKEIFIEKEKNIIDELINKLRYEITLDFFTRKNNKDFYTVDYLEKENKLSFNLKLISEKLKGLKGDEREKKLKEILDKKIWIEDKNLMNLSIFEELKCFNMEILGTQKDPNRIPQFYYQDCYLVGVTIAKYFLEKAKNNEYEIDDCVKFIKQTDLFKKLVFFNRTVLLPFFFLKEDRSNFFIIEKIKRDKIIKYKEIINYFNKNEKIFFVLRNIVDDAHSENMNFKEGHYFLVKKNEVLDKIVVYNDFYKKGDLNNCNDPIFIEDLFLYHENNPEGNYLVEDSNKKNNMTYIAIELDEDNFNKSLDLKSILTNEEMKEIEKIENFQ